MTLRAADALTKPRRAKVIKVKHCKCCGNDFFPSFPLQKGCSFDCELKLGLAAAARSKAKREQKDKSVDRRKLEQMLPRKHYVAALGAAHRAWVRARDEGKPCISCDTILTKTGQIGGDYDAGHGRSVGSAKHLEHDDRNVHGQCKRCNRRLGGNYAEYLARLPARIGQAAFDALMCDQEPRKYSIDDLKALRAHYVAKLKELKHG